MSPYSHSVLRHVGRFAAVGAAAALALPAAASAASPVQPGFERFKGCPQAPNVGSCQTTTINGGYFKLGNKTVPITNPIKLVGGVTNESTTRIVYESPGGLIASPIKVPGGLTGMTGISAAILNLITFGSNDVYATPVLVGDPVLTQDGINLPLRIKLKNNVLSSACGIGTAANPVYLKLITGTTTPPAGYTPLTGDPGVNDFDPDKLILSVNGLKYVDNTFSVPGANGCGTFFGINVLAPIDSLVNSTIGLPASAGKSEAVQSNVKIEVALDLAQVFGS